MQDTVDKICTAVERAVTESVPLLQGGGSDQEYLIEQVIDASYHTPILLSTHYGIHYGISIMHISSPPFHRSLV